MKPARSSSLQLLLSAVSITVLALIVRLVYVSIAPHADPILRRDPLYGDASGYHLLAVNLLRGQGLTWDGATPTAYRMPGYPVLVALVYATIGIEPQMVRIAQAVIGALTCVPVYAIGQRLGGWKVGGLSALGVAFHPILVYMTGWLYSETLFLLVMWLGIWLLVKLVGDATLSFVATAGIALGLSALVRSEIAWFPIFLSGSFAGFGRLRPLVFKMLAVQAILLVVVIPWAARNYFSLGRVVLFATATGSTLYGGNNPQADGGMAKEQIFVLPNMSEVQSDWELSQRALEWMASHPVDFVRLVPLKAMRFFSPADMKTDSSLLGSWTILLNSVYGLFLFVAAMGAWLNRNQAATLVLIALIAWYFLLALVFSGGTRVALPVAPALAILAACGLQSIGYFRRFQHREAITFRS